MRPCLRRLTSRQCRLALLAPSYRLPCGFPLCRGRWVAAAQPVPEPRAAVRGYSPSAGPSPTPRSGGRRPRAGARTASARSGSCPRGSAATPVCAAVQHVFPMRPRLASRRIPTRRCIHTGRTALPSQPHPALSPYWCPPGRRSSHRTPRIPATCRRPARSGCRGPSSTRPGCTRGVRRPGHGARP